MSGTWVPSSLEVVASYGYPLLLAAAFAENLLAVGLVVPGDMLVLIGGALAATRVLSLSYVLAAVTFGAVLGVNVSYLLGARGGIALVVRWGGRVGIDAARVRAAEAYFRDHGGKTVFLGSFVAGIKNVVPAIAGTSKMPYWRFAAWSGAGALGRAGVAIGFGYLLGANLDQALGHFSKFNGWTVGAGVLVVGAYVVLSKRARKVSRRPPGT